MKDLLNKSILSFGDVTVKISMIIEIIALIISVIVILVILRKAIFKTKKIEESKKYSIFNLLKYFILVIGIVIGLQVVGFNITLLLGGSAALLVGFGLGIQSIFSDFVSGFVLLVDSTVKVNDVIEINGLVSKVQDINLRTTTVLTRDDKYIILPNTDLTRNQLINWTHSDIASRFDVSVGVDYSSDVNVVMNLLRESVLNMDGILEKPVPFVRFTDYGDSSLNFSVFFWSEEVFRVEQIKSDIRVRIFNLFNTNGIKIPFPQRVVHLTKE